MRPEPTFVGDLADGSFLPDDAFDCVVLTQTLHLVYDFAAALARLPASRARGVLLMTVPGISNVDAAEWGSTWHYSFTRHSVQRMCEAAFADFEIGSDVLRERARRRRLPPRARTRRADRQELDDSDPSTASSTPPAS